MTPKPRKGKKSGSGRGNWNTDHGGSRRGMRLPEFGVWLGMRRRCADLNYADYGGRGIRVCERWATSFASFLEDMGPRPSDKHSIERVDNDGDYEPSNCVWATRDVQAANRRNRRRPAKCVHGHDLFGDNVYVRKNGKRQCKTCRKHRLQKLQETGYFREYARARRNGKCSASAE